MQSRSFRFSDGLVTVLVLGIGAVILPLTLLGSKEQSQLEVCGNRARLIARACAEHEAQVRRFPLASDASFQSIPGLGSGERRAGYSWQAKILVYLGQSETGQRLIRESRYYRTPPFEIDEQLPSWVIKQLLCPAQQATHVDPSRSDYDSRNVPGLSSYVALSSTHFVNSSGIGELPADRLNAGNGILRFPIPEGSIRGRGTQAGEVADGLSGTLLFAETVETAYAAWIDGQSTWVVGAWPMNAAKVIMDENHAYHSEGSAPWLASVHPEAVPYAGAERWSGSKDREKGPSSPHGDQVVHAFADTRVVGLSTQVDPSLYLQLISRAGGEPVVDDDLREFVNDIELEDDEEAVTRTDNHDEFDEQPKGRGPDVPTGDGVNGKPDEEGSLPTTGDFTIIPLDTVWGLDLPGTKDIRKLEPKHFPADEELHLHTGRGSLIWRIGGALEPTLPRRPPDVIDTGFVVKGTGRKALESACEVIAGGAEPHGVFPTKIPLSIVYFATCVAGRTSIREIRTYDSEIEINYEFSAASASRAPSFQLALIPVENARLGLTSVRIADPSIGRGSGNDLWRRSRDEAAVEAACKSFQFTIRDETAGVTPTPEDTD